MEPSGDIVLFVERTNELVYVARLRKLNPEPKWKRAWIGRLVIYTGPETEWASHEQAEAMVKHRGGPNH